MELAVEVVRVQDDEADRVAGEGGSCQKQAREQAHAPTLTGPRLVRGPADGVDPFVYLLTMTNGTAGRTPANTRLICGAAFAFPFALGLSFALDLPFALPLPLPPR